MYIVTTQCKVSSDGTKKHRVIVQSLVDHNLVQELDLETDGSICIANSGNGKQVWIANANKVWRLFPVDIHKQVEQVLQGRDFEQAHNLVAQADNIFEEDRVNVALFILKYFWESRLSLLCRQWLTFYYNLDVIGTFDTKDPMAAGSLAIP